MAGLMRSWSDLESYVGCNILGLLSGSSRRAARRRAALRAGFDVVGLRPGRRRRRGRSRPGRFAVRRHEARGRAPVRAGLGMASFPAVILRYFSVYGPRQRPDMAYHNFIDAVLDGEPITVFGDGRQSRGNTFVTDCVAATMAAPTRVSLATSSTSGAREEVALLDAIDILAERSR